MVISIIACITKNRAIGNNNQLLFHIKEDMKRFRTLTMGHTILMGRMTFDSLPQGALPGRRNIVVSRTLSHIEGCEVYPSIKRALAACQGEKEVFIIGGANIYEQTLPIADRLYLTIIDTSIANADAFFPSIVMNEWEFKEEYVGKTQSSTLEKDIIFHFTTGYLKSHKNRKYTLKEGDLS